jgi:hypothetical protein
MLTRRCSQPGYAGWLTFAFGESRMRWTERVIAAHKNGLSKRPPDRRGELIVRWERSRSGDGPETAVEKSLELVADGNANEVELGFYVLMDLALTESSLCRHLTELANHRSAPVRRSLAFYLSRELPPELLIAVYKTLLRDKAASVRVQAIEAIGARQYKGLLAELRALRSNEQNRKVIQSLDFWIPLLDAGYHVKPSKIPGRLEVIVATGNGIVSRSVEATDPHDPRVLRAVAELRPRP